MDELETTEAVEPTTREVEEPTENRPEWLPVMFKTPEALAASYKELERAFHKSNTLNAQIREENSVLREQLEEALIRLSEARRGMAVYD